jgi:hypothetical protein
MILKNRNQNFSKLITQFNREYIKDTPWPNGTFNKLIKGGYKNEIEELLTRDIDYNLFKFLLNVYIRYENIDLELIKKLFKNNFNNINNLNAIVSIVLHINRGDFGDMLQKALDKYYNEFLKSNLKIINTKGGVSFLAIIILALGNYNQTSCIPKLKEIAKTQKINEPSLAMAAEHSLERLGLIKKVESPKNMEKQDWKKIKQCFECKSKNIFLDKKRKELVCQNCGLVQTDKEDYLKSKSMGQ